MSRETKTVAFKVTTDGTSKSEDGQEFGKITAYGAVIGNVDGVQDKILSGAFTRTIKNAQARTKARNKKYLLPMLWSHSDQELIGGWHSLEEDNFGLKCQGDINLQTQRGREFWELARAEMSDSFSIIYEIMPNGAKYNKDGIRELSELRLYSIDPVVFPANDETLLVSVKSASGGTGFPLMDYDTEWTGSKAEKQIFDYARNADDEIVSSKARQGFLYFDPENSDTQAGYKMPYCYVDGGSFKIVPKGVIACAGVLSGGMGGLKGVSDTDISSMKSKVKTMYGRINKQFDKDLTVPWEQDGKARSRMNTKTNTAEKKTFLEHLSEEMCEDLLEDWQDVLICSLSKSVSDALKIGDQPEADIKEALAAFNDAVMAWVAQCVEYGVSDYLEVNSPDWSIADYALQYGSESKPNYGYMSRRRPDVKTMTAGDATTGGFTTDHVDRLTKATAKAVKAVETHVNALHNAADEVTALIGGSNQQNPKALPFDIKAGRTFSGSNARALQSHADDLHDLADAHTKAMTRYTKTVNNVADDLATILQGSEPTFADPNAGTADGNQEGKRSGRTPFNDRTRTTQHIRSSHDDTVTEDEIVAALGKLKALKTI